MATAATTLTAQLGNTAQEEAQNAIEPSASRPQLATGDEAAEAAGLDLQTQQDLLEVRRLHKELYQPKRNLFLRRALRAFEVLKNNPYILFNESTADYDSLAMILQGTASKEDVDLYQYQDNVYQMLALAFIAALSNDNAKVRYQPVDAQNEEDIAIAKKASTIHAYNERRNGNDALQQLELLYLWCTGSYFTYVRNIVDSDRAGTTKQPIIEMVEKTVIPARYVCPQCGGVTPEQQVNAFSSPRCPDCGNAMDQGDWYPPETMPVPMKVGDVEKPNSMTAFNIYSGLNVDADPDAQELYESAILDLEVEVPIGSIRDNYPKMYQQLQPDATGDGSTEGEFAKRARNMITSPTGTGPGTLGQSQGTYSRCWMQPKAFSILDDEAKAKKLKEKFPNGVRLVSYAGELFLQAVPEKMMQRWSCCQLVKGLGLYPFGAGDAALDIQARINDAANILHGYMDRLAFGTILADSDVLDIEALDQKAFIPGNFTGVSRTDEDNPAMRTPLSELLFQPEFHVDEHLYQYEPNLIQLAQVISGVLPQTFGGSDKNVQTAAGQQQALQTATGRLMLYLKRIREEHAQRAKNSVVCSVENMDDEMRIVMDGETDGDYRTESLLKNELTGDFLTYPDTEEGYPSTYQEIQQRIIELLTQGAKSPFLAAVLSDPDTQRVVARYVLPNEIKLPGDAERARIKIMLHQLSQGKPQVVPGPPGPNGQPGQPMVMPSLQPNPDFDDFGMIVTLTKTWLQENWQMQETNPAGFNNVLAFLRIGAQMNMQNQIKAQLAAQAAAGPPPGAGAGPARRPVPRLGGGAPPPGGPPPGGGQ